MRTGSFLLCFLFSAVQADAQVNIVSTAPTLAPVEQVALPVAKPVVSVVKHDPAKASVKITATQGRVSYHGSGTVIDSNNDTATIVTCWHCVEGNLPVWVTFPDGRVAQATVVRGNFKGDLMLLTCKIDKSASVPVATTAPKVNEVVNAYGHEQAGPLKRFASKITGINRYNGFSNLSISGRPLQGRSGGGLFNTRGELIGVCSAADGNEGLYAGLAGVQAIVKPTVKQSLTVQPTSKDSLQVQSVVKQSLTTQKQPAQKYKRECTPQGCVLVPIE